MAAFDPMYPGEITDENIRKIFRGASDFIARELKCGEFTLYAYGIDGIISGANTSEYVIRPIAENLSGNTMESIYEQALRGAVYNAVAGSCEDLDAVALKLVNGFCVVLFPGVGAIAFEVRTGNSRGPSTPEVENTVKGAKDAFVETMRVNTSLIRRHLRAPELRLHQTTVGRRSLTNVSVIWLEGITNPEFVERMKQRLNSIDIDGFLSPAVVEEYVSGSRATAFPLLQYTERTDRFCDGLLAGRVGLLVDGLPLGYLAPVDIGCFMNSQEDLAKDYVSASCGRILRYGAMLLSLILPAVYIAMTTFHQEMIPLPLLRSIIESKQAVPFPTTFEVIGLLLAFELLQESGIHLPRAIGQSVSIIGGIVVGTAAVEAKLISPGALIAVSVAGICGFVLPNRDFAEAIRMWRLALAAMGAIGGLFGVTVGFLLLLIHLSTLTSLGVAYLEPFATPSKVSLFRNRFVKEKQSNSESTLEDNGKQK